MPSHLSLQYPDQFRIHIFVIVWYAQNDNTRRGFMGSDMQVSVPGEGPSRSSANATLPAHDFDDE